MCNFYNIFLYFLIQSLFSFRFFYSVLILLTLRDYEDKLEYILLKQHQQLKTVKNCLVFFAALTIISIVLAFIFGLFA